ncbi:MAG: MFS transporter [Clostridia bacterium]|nr:MFS transporter [Clostridia bacterium]
MQEVPKQKRFPSFFAIYLFFWMAENLLAPYLGLYYEQRGLSAMQVGHINSWFSMAVIASSLTVGALGDKLGRPRRILLALLCGMIAGTFFLSRANAYAAIVMAALVYGASYAPVNGIADKLLMDKLRSRPESFGKYRMGGTIGAGIGVILSGVLLPMLGFPSLFAGYWAAAFFCIAFILSLPAATDAVHLDKARWQDYLLVIRHRRFFPIYLTMTIWGFTEVGAAQFLAMHVTRAGMESSYTSLFVGMAMLGECIGFLLVPWLIRRLKPHQMIAFSFVLQLFRMGSLALLGKIPFGAVCFSQFIGGGAFAQIYALLTQMISATFPEKVSCSAHTLKLVVNRGIGITCGSLLLGYLFDLSACRHAYGILAVCSACMALLSFLVGNQVFSYGYDFDRPS